MGYDPKTNTMDWRDEATWLAISLASGLLLAAIFYYVARFPEARSLVLGIICVAGFYVLSILVRIQNHRGRILIGRAAIKERYAKFLFPVLAFAIGAAILFA